MALTAALPTPPPPPALSAPVTTNPRHRSPHSLITTTYHLPPTIIRPYYRPSPTTTSPYSPLTTPRYRSRAPGSPASSPPAERWPRRTASSPRYHLPPTAPLGHDEPPPSTSPPPPPPSPPASLSELTLPPACPVPGACQACPSQPIGHARPPARHDLLTRRGRRCVTWAKAFGRSQTSAKCGHPRPCSPTCSPPPPRTTYDDDKS